MYRRPSVAYEINRLPLYNHLSRPLKKKTITTVSDGPRTSGVGGSWAPSQNEREGEDAYQPKVGTWGAFPRPKNISVAYGGGKRVGAGIKTDEKLKQQSIDDTKERLRAYRERMGIEVQAEKDHARPRRTGDAAGIVRRGGVCAREGHEILLGEVEVGGEGLPRARDGIRGRGQD